MSDGAESVEAATRLGAVAGNPPADEFAARDPGKHKMKLVPDGGGRKIYACQAKACGFSTYNETTAREHERRPV